MKIGILFVLVVSIVMFSSQSTAELKIPYHVDVAEYPNEYAQRIKINENPPDEMPYGVRISAWRPSGGDGTLKSSVDVFENVITITIKKYPPPGFAISSTGYETFDYVHSLGEGTFNIDIYNENVEQIVPDTYKLVVLKDQVELIPYFDQITAPGEYRKINRTRPICTYAVSNQNSNGESNRTCKLLTPHELSKAKQNDRYTKVHIPGL